MRAHGWIRGRHDADEWVRRFPELDPRWLFVTPGFNLRPTEINAAFGLVQLAKLPGFIDRRVRIRRDLVERLAAFEPWLGVQRSLPGHRHTAFALAVKVRPEAPFSRDDIQQFLESRGIQTRPIVGANLIRHPVMEHIPHRVHGNLEHADGAHYRGFMISNHHAISRSQQDYLIESIESFIQDRCGRAG
jgi:CDP-6-deoxy-D-xylo-4-hexulose-3-dehydrase